jgi:hypothetical protein
MVGAIISIGGGKEENISGHGYGNNCKNFTWLLSKNNSPKT